MQSISQKNDRKMDFLFSCYTRLSNNLSRGGGLLVLVYVRKVCVYGCVRWRGISAGELGFERRVMAS